MIAAKSLHSRIVEEIAREEAGKIIFPVEYSGLGNPGAIHMAFSRLTEKKKLARLGKGIYVKPRRDPSRGLVWPSLDEIAHAVAIKEQVIIRPTGSYALYKLGLTPLVPANVLFLTNGSRRCIQTKLGTITFKPTASKNFGAKNEIVFLAIQSLIELGEHRVTDTVWFKLTEKLKDVPTPVIRESMQYAPRFARKLVFEISNKLMIE